MFCFLGSKYKNIFPFSIPKLFFVYPAISNSQDFLYVCTLLSQQLKEKRP